MIKMVAFIPSAKFNGLFSRGWLNGSCSVSQAPTSGVPARRPARKVSTPVAVVAERTDPTCGLVRSPAPGEAKTVFTPEDWDAAERDQSRETIEWEKLKAIVPYTTLRTISKPGQYMGNEMGAAHPDWDSAEVRMILAYPDLYSIGMSNTGHVVLYSCINDTPRLLCDRAYLPGPDMQTALQELGKPVFAVESKRSITDFHVVGMSISYELCATNCLKMMELSDLPIMWEQRDTGGRFLDEAPLVFAGGLSVTSNPEPYTAFFDILSIGDGEEMLPAIGLKVADALAANPDITRKQLTLILAQEVPGVYAPRFYDMDPSTGACYPNRDDVPARPQRQNALPQPWRATALVPTTDAVHDRLSVEIRRGCTRGCVIFHF